MLCLVTQSCPILCNPTDCSPPVSSVHGDSSGNNTGVGCHALLWGIFPTQGSNPGLPYCRWIFYHLSNQESPRILEWVAYPFCRGPSQPRNQTGVSCIAGRFFTFELQGKALLITITPINYYPLVLQVRKILYLLCDHSYKICSDQNRRVGEVILTTQAHAPIYTFWMLFHSSTLCQSIYLTHIMANHCQLQLADSLYWCCQDLLFIFLINLRCFTAHLKTGKHIGSNLELSLKSVVESPKPNLDFNQQSSFEMLVWNNSKAFLDVSSMWEKKEGNLILMI